MPLPTTRVAGFSIAVLGVLAVGPDAALLRTQHDAGGTTSIIGVWRYILLAVANLAAARVLEGPFCHMLAGARRSLARTVRTSLPPAFRRTR